MTIVMIVGIVLVLQFALYWYKHKGDGGGHDGEMANALISMIGALVGAVMLLACLMRHVFT